MLHSSKDLDTAYKEAVEAGNKVEADMYLWEAACEMIGSWPRVGAGDEVDGLVVRNDIPNTNSIQVTLKSHTEMGLLAVPMDIFTLPPPAPTDLSKAIGKSREINPLIVAVDGSPDGPAYILKGSHRIDALRTLGVKSFPALVVFDNEADLVTRDKDGKLIPLSKRFPTPPVPRVDNDTPCIEAWHGTPHFFERFSMDHVGDGEGHQSYGFGLYFSTNRKVAEHYQHQLGYFGLGYQGMDLTPEVEEILDDVIKPNKAYLSHVPPHEAKRRVGELITFKIRKVMDAFTEHMAEMEMEPVVLVKRRKELNEALNMIPELPWGMIFKVEIRASDDEFLDWDKPIGKQSEKVRGALKREYGARCEWREVKSKTGGEFYNTHLDGIENGRRASEALDQLGIKGIRYLDQGSRDGKGATYNLVVFDDRIVTKVSSHSVDEDIELEKGSAKSSIGKNSPVKASKINYGSR